MTKRTNRKHHHNLARLISGLFVGGVLLFAGTGYITSSYAAENNQNVDVTAGANIETSTYNSGLVGAESAAGDVTAKGAINITDGAAAVIGKLDKETNELVLTDGVNLTMDAVNLTIGDNTTAGTLYIGGVNAEGKPVASSLILNPNDEYSTGLMIGTGTGTVTTATNSAVTVNSGSSIVNNSLITIGNIDEEVEKITGTLTVLNGGNLTNNKTVTLGENGSLVFGTETESVIGSEVYSGSGAITNAGTITIYNAGDEEESTITLNGYSDEDSGSLTATGKIFLSALTGDDPSINGEITADRLQLVAASDGTVGIGEDAEIEVTGLTLGTEGAALNLSNEGTITAGSLSMDNGSTLTNEGDLYAKSLTINNEDAKLTLSSTGAIYSDNLTLTNGNFEVTGSLNKYNESTGVLNLEGGTMTIGSSTGIQLKDMTLNYSGGLITSAEDVDGVLDIMDGSSFQVKSSGTQNVKTDMTVSTGGNLNLSDGNTLTFAAGKNLTLSSGSVLTVDFSNTSTEPLINLSQNTEAEEGEEGGLITMAEGSQIEIKDLSKISTGEHKLAIAEFDSTGNTFNSTLDDLNSAFLTLSDNRATAEEDKYYTLSLYVNNFESLGQTANQKAFGRYVDSFRGDKEKYTEETGEMLEDIMALKTGDEVRTVYDTLTPAGRANGLMLAMTDPWQNAFDQMNWSTHRGYTKKGNPYAQYGPSYRGQMEGEYVYDESAMSGYGYYPGQRLIHSVFGTGDLQSNSAWGSFYHTSLNTRTDNNSPDYGISRTGVTVGYDMINSNNVVAGMMFDYSQPFLYSGNQRINTGNFNLGWYGKREFYNQMELSCYIGGGFQNYTSKRAVDSDTLSWDEYYQSKYNGNNLALAVQLARNYELNYWSVIRPFVQFDMQQVWQDASTEEGNATALKYDKADWNRTFVRAGLESEVNNQFIRLTGRCFYSGQLNNDSAPSVRAAFIGDNTGNMMTIQGVDVGRNFFDVGVGALGYFDCDYRWAISGNYDFAAGDKTTAHTGKVNLSYSF